MTSQQPLALVTGANRGIGLEVVSQLARMGYQVLLGSRDLAKGEAAAHTLLGVGLPVLAHQLDVADLASIERLKGKVTRDFGRLEVLVNNAGILYDTWQHATTANFEQVEKAMITNLYGPWHLSQAFASLLRQAGRRGRLVNVSSEAGSLAHMGNSTPAYSVSKAALNALTRQLAAELKPAGVLVNAVCPGWVATELGGAGGRPIADGAASVVWAVTLPDDGPTSGFFRDGKPLPW